MASIGTQNISFSGLKSAYVAGGGSTANNNLKDGETDTEVKLSYFYSSEFTDDTSIGSSGAISVSDFKNKTFGSSVTESKVYSTSNFNFNDDFSGEPDRLYPVDESELTQNSPNSTSSSKHARLFHSNVTYNYPSILLCPQSGDPTIGTTDDAEVWIKMQLNSLYHYQIGIIHKQGKSTWNNVASSALRNRHTTYKDRIALHTYGYVTHAGHDVELSTKIDELMNTTITNNTTATNYHNRIGTTAGSGDGSTTVSSTYYYLQSDVDFYQSKTSTSSDYYVGLKLNYYDITLTGNVSSSSSTISNIQLNGSQLAESDNVYTGMYLSSTDSNFPDSAMIKTITYDSGNTNLVMGDEITVTGIQNYNGSSGTITFKTFGQRLEFQYTDSSFLLPKNIGPNHIILPRKYQTGGSNLDIDSWAFFLGDSTTGNNSATFSIQTSNPSSYPDITSSFLEISNRFISSPSSSDYPGSYDVSETELGLSGSYRLYIGFKATSSVHYYSDICIAAIQVVNSSGVNKNLWIFNSSSHSNWKTKEGTVGIQSASGFPITPETASSYSYSTLGTTATYDRASLATRTTSSYTGAADGISSSTTNLSPGNGTITQSSSMYYLFRETSGTSSLIIDSGVVIQSPVITLAVGDKIRVAHLMVGHSNYPMDENDSLYLGAYADNSGV